MTNNFSSNFKSIMNLLQLTQEDVAKVMNVTRQSVSLYVNGETLPTVDKVILFCNHYKMSANTLLGIDFDD